VADWFKTTGVVRYDPPRGNMKNRTKWWCVIQADDDIARYARYWVNKHVLNPLALPGKSLCHPAWGAHVSIVRGEKPPPGTEHLWREHEGKRIEFEYSNEAIQTGQDPTKPRPDHFWFLPIRCDLALGIRKDFGLYTSYTLHMTIGRTY
jgi:hypothetical protein